MLYTHCGHVKMAFYVCTIMDEASQKTQIKVSICVKVSLFYYLACRGSSGGGPHSPRPHCPAGPDNPGNCPSADQKTTTFAGYVSSMPAAAADNTAVVVNMVVAVDTAVGGDAAAAVDIAVVFLL